MSSDFHIKFDGVEGESTHKDHKGEVEVLSWSWGVSQGANISGGGMGVGKADPLEFTFTHLYDKSSPVLAKYCAGGKHFPTVKMTTRKAGQGQKDYLTITMKEVMITHVAPSGTKGGDVHESVSCKYKDIEFAYKPQSVDGSLGGEVKFGWNNNTTEIR